jgi:phosphonate metabolism protein (transferase hexapeptide repeat family)
MSNKKLSPDGAFIHPLASVRDCSFGAWTEVGARSDLVETTFDDYSYVVNDSEIIYTDVGKFCSIAAHTRINPGQHPLEKPALHHFTYRSNDFMLGDQDKSFFQQRRENRVTIGHDVWIGHGAIIQGGVEIGHGAVIGSGAVVTHSVDPFTIVTGVPARPMRKRFDETTIERLLALQWWHWPHDRLKQCLDDFRRLSVKDFLDKHQG